jgi:hypothetical protein
MLGAEIAANAFAEGYTLLLADSSFTINSSYYTKQVRYDARNRACAAIAWSVSGGDRRRAQALVTGRSGSEHQDGITVGCS